jgi:hypothetical protein
MDFFSGSKPNLISNNTLNEINNLIGNDINPVKNIKNIKINNGVSNFYSNYIEHNLFFIALAILFLLFLYWRYETKNSEEMSEEMDDIKPKKSKKHKKDKKDLGNAIIDDLIDTLENNTYEKNQEDQGPFVATFNPSLPVSVQQSYSNVMDIPVKVDGVMTTQQQYYNTPEPEYQYLPFINNKINRADTYTGLYNTYNNSMDGWGHPYDWDMNYNKNTYDAIDFATQKNQENIAMLNTIYDTDNNNLAKNIM